MLNATFFYLILTLLFKSQAYASLGPKPSQKLNANISKLEIKKETSAEICSASIIAPHYLKMAAHCLNKAQRLTIDCPNKTIFSISPLNSKTHSNYNHQFVHKMGGARTYDMAIIDLSEHNLQAFEKINRIPKNLSESQNIINSANYCFIAGYGLHEQSHVIGDYNESLVDPKQIKFDSEGTLKNIKVGHFLVLPGDSGGSLICDYKSQYYDIGTVSGHDWDFNSYFAPSYYLNTLMTSKPSPSLGTPSLPLKLKQRPNLQLKRKYKIKPYSEVRTKEGAKSTVDLNKVYIIVDKIDGRFAYGQIVNSSYSKYFICTENILCEKTAYGRVKIKYLEPDK